jgi:hypothetical protein
MEEMSAMCQSGTSAMCHARWQIVAGHMCQNKWPVVDRVVCPKRQLIWIEPFGIYE